MPYKKKKMAQATMQDGVLLEEAIDCFWRLLVILGLIVQVKQGVGRPETVRVVEGPETVRVFT